MIDQGLIMKQEISVKEHSYTTQMNETVMNLQEKLKYSKQEPEQKMSKE